MPRQAMMPAAVDMALYTAYLVTQAFSLIPHSLPTGEHLQKLWGGRLVRRRPLAGLVGFCRCLILRQQSGTRASRADQGSAPLGSQAEGPRKRLLRADYIYSRLDGTYSQMPPKLTKLELEIMEIFWTRGACSVREIQEAFPKAKRPAYTTVQTTVYRMEGKGALRCVKRISNANIFEAAISRNSAQNRLIDDLLGLFGARPVMARLVETGKLTLEDVEAARQVLKKAQKERQR